MPSDLTIAEKAEKLGMRQGEFSGDWCLPGQAYTAREVDALYAERFPAPDYRAALTPTTDGEREAREALSATEAPPTHHHSWRLYCFNHGHSVDTSTGSTEPPTWATWSRPCRRCDAMGEDCREFGVDHSEWDTDPPQTVAADHLRTALALLATERAKAADAARERDELRAQLAALRSVPGGVIRNVGDGRAVFSITLTTPPPHIGPDPVDVTARTRTLTPKVTP